MNCAEKQSYVAAEPFKAFALPFRLTVAHADERHNRRSYSSPFSALFIYLFDILLQQSHSEIDL